MQGFVHAELQHTYPTPQKPLWQVASWLHPSPAASSPLELAPVVDVPALDVEPPPLLVAWPDPVVPEGEELVLPPLLKVTPPDCPQAAASVSVSVARQAKVSGRGFNTLPFSLSAGRTSAANRRG
jgi:hypothetical protein